MRFFYINPQTFPVAEPKIRRRFRGVETGSQNPKRRTACQSGSRRIICMVFAKRKNNPRAQATKLRWQFRRLALWQAVQATLPDFQQYFSAQLSFSGFHTSH